MVEDPSEAKEMRANTRSEGIARRRDMPRSMENAEVRMPHALPGALAENAAERPDEFGVPAEKAVVRMPAATEEALMGERVDRRPEGS